MRIRICLVEPPDRHHLTISPDPGFATIVFAGGTTNGRGAGRRLEEERTIRTDWEMLYWFAGTCREGPGGNSARELAGGEPGLTPVVPRPDRARSPGFGRLTPSPQPSPTATNPAPQPAPGGADCDDGLADTGSPTGAVAGLVLGVLLVTAGAFLLTRRRARG